MLFLMLRADVQGTGWPDVFMHYLGEALYNPVLENIHVLLISCISGLTFAAKIGDRFVLNMLTRMSWTAIIRTEFISAWLRTSVIYVSVICFYYFFITLFGLPLGLTIFSTDPTTVTPASSSFHTELIQKNLGLSGMFNLLFALSVTCLQIGVIVALTFISLLKSRQVSISLFLPWLIYQFGTWLLLLVPGIGADLAPLGHVLEFPAAEFSQSPWTALPWPTVALTASLAFLTLITRSHRTVESVT